MTLFGDRISAEVIEIRSYWIIVGSKFSDWYPKEVI